LVAVVAVVIPKLMRPAEAVELAAIFKIPISQSMVHSLSLLVQGELVLRKQLRVAMVVPVTSALSRLVAVEVVTELLTKEEHELELV
jgi:hypothetical protein